jgi:hypothetical protein
MAVGGGALFVVVFLACAVEAVEALTIVLAVGTSRDWRSAIAGVVAGVLLPATVVAVLGPAVTAIPLQGCCPSLISQTKPSLETPTFWAPFVVMATVCSPR